MTPKKATKKAATAKGQETQEDVEINIDKDDDDKKVNGNADNKDTANAGDKRKIPFTNPEEPSSKAIKLENSSDSTRISFLLSPQGLELCRNSISEPKSAQNSKNELRDYFSSDLTPFEHLVCAIILSRPISHNLGQRTIATVLNEPWSWNNAQKVIDAGKRNKEGKTQRVEAMEDAKTQHRQKTANELGGLAQCIVEEQWDEDSDGTLKGLLQQVQKDESKMQENIRKLVKGKVKGLGDTGLDIFLRRVQGCEGWEKIGWFIDAKTRDALDEAGLPTDADDLKKLVGGSRKDFVIVLERTLGIMLEGKSKELKQQE